MRRFRPIVLVAVALAIIEFSGGHAKIQNAITDFRFHWTQREASRDTIVVAVDARSIEAIGVWPWPRQLHAELLRKLALSGARDVAFDVDFSSASNLAADRDLQMALNEVGGSTILPMFMQPTTTGDVSSQPHINRPLQQFNDSFWPAIVNVRVESDGLVRRYPFGAIVDQKFVPSMAAIIAGKHNESDPSFFIDFGIRATSLQAISYVDVLKGEPSTLNALKDKKVIVGATAIELGDRLSIPNGQVIAGPVLQALATESILQNRTLRPTSNFVSVTIICFISALMMLAWRRGGAGTRVLLLFGLAVTVESTALIIQTIFPIIFDTALVHVTIATYILAIALDELDFRQLLSLIAEMRFRRIAMSIGDGLICADESGSIRFWNSGAAAIFGYDAKEAEGKRFESLCGLTHIASGMPFFLTDMSADRYQLQGGVILELQALRKDGSAFPIEACLSGWIGTDGFQYGAVLRDISVRRREAERIRYLAEYDNLTDLPNRNSLVQHLTLNCQPLQPATVLLIGLDKFQQLNDMWGYSCGDLVLSAVAHRLKSEIASDHFVARLSGDEFAVVVKNANTKLVAETCVRIEGLFTRPFLAGTRPHCLTARIGTATFPVDAENPEDLIGNGHLALRKSKRFNGHATVHFESALRIEVEGRLTLEAELVEAYSKNEFELFYQPQVRLSDCKLIGAEALIRWRHPTRGLVSPAEFMPIVNASSISARVSAWVLETACTQGALWEQAGNPIRIGVNLSPSQLLSGSLLNSVKDSLARARLSPALLELEVTEDILLSDAQRVLQSFNEIQKLGVRIVFDDFGTGYASLSYLKKYPLDGLKIDRSFVSEILLGTEDAAIVSATIDLSNKLGLSVIAEGIENRETAELLMQLGCQEGQGYHFGRPVPNNEFEAKFLRPQDQLSKQDSLTLVEC